MKQLNQNVCRRVLSANGKQMLPKTLNRNSKIVL